MWCSVHREGNNMATWVDRTGLRAQAMRARTTTDVQIGLPRPIEFATVQYFIPLPRIMFGFFWVSRHRSIILAKKWTHFRADFEKFQEICENWNYWKRWLITKRLGFSSKQSLESHPEVFLTVNPIPIRKQKTATNHHFIVLLAFWKEKQGRFFRRFFRLSANFRPYSSAIFHPNTHINVFCPLSAYDKWWCEQKITTFSGKVFSSELL